MSRTRAAAAPGTADLSAEFASHRAGRLQRRADGGPAGGPSTFSLRGFDERTRKLFALTNQASGRELGFLDPEIQKKARKLGIVQEDPREFLARRAADRAGDRETAREREQRLEDAILEVQGRMEAIRRTMGQPPVVHLFGPPAEPDSGPGGHQFLLYVVFQGKQLEPNCATLWRHIQRASSIKDRVLVLDAARGVPPGVREAPTLVDQVNKATLVGQAALDFASQVARREQERAAQELARADATKMEAIRRLAATRDQLRTALEDPEATLDYAPVAEDGDQEMRLGGGQGDRHLEVGVVTNEDDASAINTLDPMYVFAHRMGGAMETIHQGPGDAAEARGQRPRTTPAPAPATRRPAGKVRMAVGGINLADANWGATG